MRGPWLLFQLADSAFPTGGFAHSAGLEALFASGEIGRERIARWAHEIAWQAGRGALPLVNAAHDDIADVARWDRRAEVFLTSHVARRASRTQGRALLETASSIFSDPRLAEVRGAARAEGHPCHIAPMFGAVAAILGISRREADSIFLYQTIRSALSAAIRLGVVGPHEAQRIQFDAAPVLDEILDACERLGPDDLVQTAPLLDLFGSTHDRLYARLFQS